MSETTTLPEGSRWTYPHNPHWQFHSCGVIYVDREGALLPSAYSPTEFIIQQAKNNLVPCDSHGQPIPAPQSEPPDDGWFLVSETRDKIPVSTMAQSEPIVMFVDRLEEYGAQSVLEGTFDGKDFRSARGGAIWHPSHWQPWPAPPKGAK